MEEKKRSVSADMKGTVKILNNKEGNVLSESRDQVEPEKKGGAAEECETCWRRAREKDSRARKFEVVLVASLSGDSNLSSRLLAVDW
jgi:hypothetical protein